MTPPSRRSQSRPAASRRPSPLPRYSARPLPPYAFVPGESPHPHRDPDGHGLGLEPPSLAPWSPTGWRDLDDWLYAIDLFNGGYWWECHEALEGLWNAAGRTSAEARFVQGLIAVSAGLLNHRRGRARAARRQVARGLRRLAATEPGFMGLDVVALEIAARDHLVGCSPPPVIHLVGVEAGSMEAGP